MEIPFEGRTNFEIFQDAWVEEPTETTLVVLLLGTFFLIYVLESIWRMRMVTAMGVALSARLINTTQTLLAGLAGVAFMWVSQGFLLVLFFIGLSLLFRDQDIDSLFTGLFITWVIVIVLGVLIYTYYRLFRVWALRHAVYAGFYRPA